MDLIDELLIEKRGAERRFATCVLAGERDLAVVDCAWLTPEMFTDTRYGKFWDKILGGMDEVRAAAECDITGDLMSGVSEIPMLTRYVEYARQVSEYAYKIRIMDGVQDVTRSIGDGDILNARQILADLADDRETSSATSVTSSTASQDFCQNLTNLMPVIVTGINDIDRELGGVYLKELSVVAARTSVGKSAIVLQIAQNVATAGKKVLLVSAEMSTFQLWARMACRLAGISWFDVRSGRAPNDKIAEVKRMSEILARRLGDNLIINDQISTPQEIHHEVAHHRPDLVIIDHLAELSWPDQRMKKLEWYGLALKYLRRHVARGLNTHVMMVHQLNRLPETRTDHRPQLADLKDSGDIEQIADLVMMCHREDLYSDTPASNQRYVQFEVWIRKNRQGGRNGCVTLVYDLEMQWFTGLSP